MNSRIRILALLVFVFMPAFASATPAPLVIDATQSRVEILVKATIDSFIGKLDGYQAAITVDGGHITAATFRFHFTDIHTGKSGRDEAMHEWQETTTYPDGVFTLVALEPIADGHFNVRGTLVLHGQSHEIAFPLSAIRDHNLYAFDGEAPIDTRDFGLPIIRKFGLLKVDPLVKVRFHLQGTVNAL